MSSHHFVTEAQSDGLYIVGSNIDPELLGQLLEWNPMVVVEEAMIGWVLDSGIKIDTAVAMRDLSSVIPYPVTIWDPHSLTRHMNDAISKKKAGRWVVVGPEVEGAEQLLQWCGERFQNAVIYAGNMRMIPLKAGEQFRKWMPSGKEFGIWPEDGAAVEGQVEGRRNIYKTQREGFVKVNVYKDIMLSDLP